MFITSTSLIKRTHNLRQDASQSSTTLLAQVINQGSENNGQLSNTDNILEIPSLTSTNNFINLCVDLALTNGQPSEQLSCNPAPMGHIPSRQTLPSTRFTVPHNGDVFLENASISVKVASNNFKTGNAVNPNLNYLAAPQQLDSNGLVLGHYHLIVDALESFGQSSPTDPTKPILSTELGTPTTPLSTTIQLPVGFYRISAIAHAANHQPVILPISQHGSLNDVVYIIVQPNPNSKRAILQETLQPADFNFVTTRSNNTSSQTKFSRVKRQASDPSTSLTLNSTVISSGFTQDGTGGTTSGTFTPSLTSINNFINYCATLTDVPLTNGTQLNDGDSCNPIPIGLIPSIQNMPSVKFTSPAYNDTIKENTPFLVSLNVTNFVSGKSTSTEVNFLTAPQQLVQAGRIIGHTGIVIEEYTNDSTPSNPSHFLFASTVDAGGSTNSGIFTVNVSSGLPVGSYRLSSIVLTANHQPVVMPLLDHGAIDDAIFFSVTENGGGPPPLPTLSTAAAIASTSPTSSLTSTAPADTTSAADQTSPRKSQSKGGEVAGGVVGAVLFCGIVLVILVFRWKRRKIKKDEAEDILHSQISLTPFENWHRSNPSIVQIVIPASDPKCIFPLSPEQDSSHVTSLASTSSLVRPSTPRKSGRQSTNVTSERSWRLPDRRGSTVSRTSIAPSYHTTAG